jgi:G3E family GTPase
MLQQHQQHQQHQHQHQHHQQHYQHHQQSASSHYVADKPSPAQMTFLSSWMSQSVNKYAYYLDRGNGYVTRLIPADVLPALSEIPAQEATAAGMEVLQPLKGSPPAGVQDMNQRVTVKVSWASARY